MGATTRAADATRLVALGGIRVTGLAIAVGAAVVGVVFASVSIVGPEVWVFSSDGTGAGQLIALPLPLRMAHAVAFLLPCVTVAAFALLVADLAWRVRREVRFVPAVSRTVAAMAVVLAAGSWLSEISINVARWTGLVYPNDVDPAKVDVTTLPIDWGVRMQTLVPNWPLLGLAIVLGVLAYIIRAGERLQRDSEGLV
ncbi:MAG TPA: hypothetical protein VL043_03030 [Protaetiibacter sp.]|nr:hypothetical protein [Protaetiibacter sp.]